MAASRWRLLVALPLGLLIGRVPLVRQLIDPTIQILRPVPVTAWLPLAMIIFGLGPRSAFFLVFLGAFYPILVNTIFGVRSVEPRLFEAASMLGCTGAAQFFRVVLPAALPSIFTGMRLGLGFAWVVIVVGEMTGVQTGLGRHHHGSAPALAHRDRDLRHDRDRRVRLSVRPARDADRQAAVGMEPRAWLRRRSPSWK